MRRSILSMAILAFLGLAACSHDRSPNGKYDPNNPGFEYAPENDMYKSVPYDPMTQYEGNTMPFADSMNQRKPAKGTIAYGKISYNYPYAAGPEGYEASAANKNPVSLNDSSISEGKRLYEIYCWHCHGMEGNGDGPIMASGKFPPPFWKSYNSDYIRALPEGKMFHSITFGKNLMGPHGPLLNPGQRWSIIHYIKNRLAGANKPAGGTQTTDTTKTNTQTQNTTPKAG